MKWGKRKIVKVPNGKYYGPVMSTYEPKPEKKFTGGCRGHLGEGVFEYIKTEGEYWIYECKTCGYHKRMKIGIYI